jgi:hypothetical protein
MKRTGLIRLGGLVAMVCGIAATTLGLLYVLEARGVTLGSTEKALQKGHYETPVLTILLVGVLAAIAALHILQRGRYGRQGALASLASFAGLAMIGAAWSLAERVVPITLAGPVGIVCLVAASVGIVGLGIVTIGAGVLPRWAGAAVIAGSPPAVGLEFMFLAVLGAAALLSGEIVWVLAGVPWVLVGYAIVRASTRLSEQPSRVR